MSKAFQKAKFDQNLTSGSGSKQRFSLLQEKSVIQAVCLRTQAVSIKALKPVLGLKGRLWVCRKSQKISTASDQYFLSYVNPPPPSRNRVNYLSLPAGIGLNIFLCQQE